MRRDNRKGNFKGGSDTKKALYISASVVAIGIIAFVITFFVYGNKLQNETQIGSLNTSIVDNSFVGNTEATGTQLGRDVNEMLNEVEAEEEETTNSVQNTTDTTKYAINTSEQENVVKSSNSSTKSKTTSTNTTKQTSNTNSTSKKTENATTKSKATQEASKTETKEQDPKFKKPVEGEIIREYAKEQLVYSNTLGEWVTHRGIDIKASKTTVVSASSDGTVKSIKNDPRYGLTVVIEHANGFTTVYSNLLTAEFVVEGEKVKQGQTIGTVGNTASFEISDEAHLHFEIKKDGQTLNPELYLQNK